MADRDNVGVLILITSSFIIRPNYTLVVLIYISSDKTSLSAKQRGGEAGEGEGERERQPLINYAKRFRKTRTITEEEKKRRRVFRSLMQNEEADLIGARICGARNISRVVREREKNRGTEREREREGRR